MNEVRVKFHVAVAKFYFSIIELYYIGVVTNILLRLIKL